jgi:hypothetical protein
MFLTAAITSVLFLEVIIIKSAKNFARIIEWIFYLPKTKDCKKEFFGFNYLHFPIFDLVIRLIY